MSRAQSDLLAAAQQLQQQQQPYALVTVLRAQAPASARPGDKALVTAQGFVHGWIGGGCAQPAVLRTVAQALRDGRARMIRIAPAEAGAPGGPGDGRDLHEVLGDVLQFGMSCHSGGTLELFVDPMLPAERLVVIGDSPVAVALAGLASRVGLQVIAVAQGADASRFADAQQVIATDDAGALAAQVAPGSFVVVATQGRRDVQGLRAALALQARRVWFVASARKAQVLRASLVEAGHDAAAVHAIVAPAGQSIGAQTPEEIALSVLAAVVAARRGAASTAVAVEAVAGEVVQPFPERAPVAASCCGGSAAAATPQAAPGEAAGVAAAAVAAVAAVAGGGSCCGH